MTSEFVSSLSLSRHDHDRDSVARSREGHLDAVWALASTRVIVLRDGKALGRRRTDVGGDETLELVMFPPAELAEYGATFTERLYLGRTAAEAGDGEYFVAAVMESDAALDLPASTADPEWADLRIWGHAMSERDTGLFTQALALANWHESHRFSPATGEPTQATSAGWVRTTPSNRQLFPRTDVAVIVLVTDDHDRILLGNNAMWESNRFSLLAGYVDPGESLETAVAREVFEESGLHVDRVEYMGSQPWPFPASLMVGFVARVRADVDATDVRPDGEEILALRWFTRDDLRTSLDDVVLPGRTSIARSLIEHWFGEPLDQDAPWVRSR